MAGKVSMGRSAHPWNYTVQGWLTTRIERISRSLCRSPSTSTD
jgi:hypothetical protein